MRRAQETSLIRDLDKKMVILTGPRQVGKTTLARNLKTTHKRFSYLNYDADDDRRVIVKRLWNREADLVVLDEIHKHKGWKSLVKGIYDTEGVRPRILVTGSARLDLYRRGGDSLAGRYFLHRLLPLSVAELRDRGNPVQTLDQLIRFGGFPEPFLGQSETAARRWRQTHIERIIREDVQDLEPVNDVRALILLVDLLRERVGSPVSAASLARDLQVSPHTVKRWLGILEAMYVVFRVTPWHRNIARAVLKEPKIYFYDTGAVRGDEGALLENAVAVSLLKHLLFREDTHGIATALHYLRDKQKREVDFVLVEERTPRLLVEVKTSAEAATPAIKHFAHRTGVKAVQIVRTLKRPLSDAGVNLQPASDFLADLEC